MGKTWRRGMAVALAAACLALFGCGGGGDGGRANLEAQLATLEDEKKQADADLKKAQDDLAARNATLDAINTRLAKLEEDEDDDDTATPSTTHAGLFPAGDDDDETPATPPTTTTTTPTTTTTTPTTPTAEANQRAQKLKEVLPGGTVSNNVLPDIMQADSPVEITAPTASSLKLKHGGFRDATLGGAGLRSATMALTVGGDSGKTVVYTDRELRRPFLEHYANLKATAAAQRIQIDGTVDTTAVPATISFTGDIFGKEPLKVTNGPPSQIGATAKGIEDNPVTPTDETDAEATESRTRVVTRTSFSGSVNGISGTFLCAGVNNCMIALTGAYNDDGTAATANKLSALTVSSTTDALLYFRPGSTPFSLCDDAARCTFNDNEYMVFGYWREDPKSAASQPKFNVFAKAFNGDRPASLPTGDIDATYDGKAVGVYVEQDPTNPVETHRQGEFTADVDLTLNGAPSDNLSTTLTGTIDDFVATPTGGSAAPRTAGRWVVTLLGVADEENNNATARIDNLTGIKSGSWEHTFVRAHANAREDTPPAVTGTFNTRILDFVHLKGAFGAEKR